MKTEIKKSIETKMSEWDYAHSEIQEALDSISKYTENHEEIVDYIITDASDSVPNRYDESALDVHFLTNSAIINFVYDAETIKVSLGRAANVEFVQVDRTTQRVELKLRYTNREYAAATYNEDQFSEIESFARKVMEIVGG
jgi:hypothetical protein